MSGNAKFIGTPVHRDCIASAQRIMMSKKFLAALIFALCLSDTEGVFLRARDFKNAARALNVATSATSGGAEWVFVRHCTQKGHHCPFGKVIWIAGDHD